VATCSARSSAAAVADAAADVAAAAVAVAVAAAAAGCRRQLSYQWCCCCPVRSQSVASLFWLSGFGWFRLALIKTSSDYQVYVVCVM